MRKFCQFSLCCRLLPVHDFSQPPLALAWTVYNDSIQRCKVREKAMSISNNLKSSPQGYHACYGIRFICLLGKSDFKVNRSQLDDHSYGVEKSKAFGTELQVR